ncbi:DUF167 domain-containing protein [Archaeoglobus profundus]|uniref:UPF0235 protein Arcpr_0292 n=1 Tax=Archaeoglobus profundus (strain DSM 5631 / JCM 9629 / NBRC 100127 / Av18) TaxID=572546 RepID=D2RGD7_ARCPA|nr:DUF167 domain-containing protein [Archaeoglobus profundus]ADB57362.1 protein of unknown function DUF167 [Archaeoglobus profundus DSM 5631]
MKETDKGILIEVDVSPNAKRTAITGYDPWRKALKVSVKSPPRGGKANRELTDFLGGIFNCKVEIVKGEKSTKKTVLLKGLSLEKALSILKELGVEVS